MMICYVVLRIPCEIYYNWEDPIFDGGYVSDLDSEA